ncbi:MAG TPA: hypothetical protein VKT82_20160 [Ktedonobacterales bacterium]|nr:hypothetical protein [Ktedonobacterales bacterium]
MKTLAEAAPPLLLELRKRLSAAYAQGKLKKADLDEGVKHLNALYVIARKSEKQGHSAQESATEEETS